jgi:hypothetical protein
MAQLGVRCPGDRMSKGTGEGGVGRLLRRVQPPVRRASQ